MIPLSCLPLAEHGDIARRGPSGENPRSDGGDQWGEILERSLRFHEEERYTHRENTTPGLQAKYLLKSITANFLIFKSSRDNICLSESSLRQDIIIIISILLHIWFSSCPFSVDLFLMFKTVKELGGYHQVIKYFQFTLSFIIENIRQKLKCRETPNNVHIYDCCVLVTLPGHLTAVVETSVQHTWRKPAKHKCSHLHP